MIANRAVKILIGTLIVWLGINSCLLPLGPTLATPAQSLLIQTGLTDIADNNAVTAVLTALYEPALGTRHPDNPNFLQYQTRLLNYFTSYGLAPATQAATCPSPKFADHPLTMNNLIAARTGVDPALPPVLVTAHWDAVPVSPGLDDNGSGCAGVLEIARVIFAQGLQFRRTIVFVLFALEEETLTGSAHYAANLTQFPAMVFNMDMIGFTSPREKTIPAGGALLGFPETGDFIGVFASHRTERAGLTFIAAAETFVPALKYYFALCDDNISNNPLLTMLMRSDHTSFWKYGAPALMITDTADFREGASYHTADDLMGTLDFPFMLNTIKAVFAAVCVEAELIAP